MIRSYVRSASSMGIALLAVFAVSIAAPAQTAAPAASAPDQAAAPQAPAPAAAPIFPKVNPANFTASTPSKETLEAFLQSSWGKVPNRVWQVQAILKTPVEGLSKVVVLIGDKTGKEQVQAMVFFAFADGKHFIAGDRLVAVDGAPRAAETTAAAKQQPAASPKTPAAAQPAAAPTATAPAAENASETINGVVFPKPNPANFTASAPTLETVKAFLQATWGFNENFVWEVEALQKTSFDGLTRVVVLFGDKTSKEKPQPIVLFVLPDGTHLAAGEQILPFGAKPFADNRAKLEKEAIGPYRGSAAKDLEIVEFADFQCPHCRMAQATMEKLAVDYPQARIVYESVPIPSIHPQSFRAATYGVCVAKLAGSAAFFNFASAVFEGQDALMTEDGATLTLNSSLTKAGADPEKVKACAATDEAKATVEASMKLANDLEIFQVPTLVINGRPISATAPYETLKKVIDFQIKLDGVK